MKIHRGDSVVVISGDEAANTPRRVIQVLDGGKKLLVEGVNKVFKHVKRGHPKSQQGGRLHLETPIDTSKVMLYCGSCNRGVKVGYRYKNDGTKERVCRKCSGVLSTVSPPRPRYATKK